MFEHRTIYYPGVVEEQVIIMDNPYFLVEDAAKELLKKGWQPLGPVQEIHDSQSRSGYSYMQTFVKYAEIE